jgi:hypothetical protein
LVHPTAVIAETVIRFLVLEHHASDQFRQFAKLSNRHVPLHCQALSWLRISSSKAHREIARRLIWSPLKGFPSSSNSFSLAAMSRQASALRLSSLATRAEYRVAMPSPLLLSQLLHEHVTVTNPASLGSLSRFALPMKGGIITFTGKW